MLETQVVWVSNFQKSACLLTFISGRVLLKVDEDTFNVFISKVQNEQGILSLEVGIEAIAIRIISFRCPCRLLDLISVAHEQIVGASGDWAPVKQQPWHEQGIMHHSPPPHVLAARCHCTVKLRYYRHWGGHRKCQSKWAVHIKQIMLFK